MEDLILNNIKIQKLFNKWIINNYIKIKNIYRKNKIKNLIKSLIN